MLIYRNPKIIKAISFDLDDTLYDNRPVIQNVEAQMAKWLHFNHPITASISLDKWDLFKKDVLQKEPELRNDVTLWRQKQIEFGLIQLGYSQQNALKASIEGIQHALYLRNLVDVPKDTHSLLSLLADKFPLVAITNGNVDIEKIGLSHYFQFALKAGTHGRAKPHGDMFELAAEMLTLPTKNILHVGDHLTSDVQGAVNAGFQACWLNLTNDTIRPNKALRMLPDIEIRSLNHLTYLL